MTVDLLGALRREGALLAGMPADALNDPVPTVPGWTLQHVVRHTGKVHRWVIAVLDTDPSADARALAQQVESLPKGPDCLPAYRDALDAVAQRLETADLSAPASTFVGPGTVGFWLRRQAHEVGVHRIDAADAVHAAGGPAPVPLDPETAADGIAELTELQLVHRFQHDRVPTDVVGRTVHVHGTDASDVEWTFTVGTDGVRSARGHAKGDVALRGTAADLLLVLWRRRPLDAVTVFGDASVAEGFLEGTRF